MLIGSYLLMLQARLSNSEINIFIGSVGVLTASF